MIGPIGEDGSESRREADWLLRGIVKPVLESEPFQYDVKRADNFTTPGLITSQIIIEIFETDLVVADLTGQNPNAFYELAIAHMAEKPVIHMIQKDENVPFDVKDYRAIRFTREEIDAFEAAKVELAQQADAIEKPDFKVSNPITSARGHQVLKESADPRDQLIAEFQERQKALESEIGKVKTAIGSMLPLVRSKRVEDVYSTAPNKGGLFGLGSNVFADNELARALRKIETETDPVRSKLTGLLGAARLDAQEATSGRQSENNSVAKPKSDKDGIG